MFTKTLSVVALVCLLTVAGFATPVVRSGQAALSVDGVSVPVCCLKSAYCCNTNPGCCSKAEGVSPATEAAVRDASTTALPVCCLKRAYCCSVRSSCCK